MPKEMIINAVAAEDVRVAVLNNGVLEHFFEETLDRFRTRGNIYLGKVANTEQSLQACFVEYGENRQGFLPQDEILPMYCPSRSDKEQRAPRRIEESIRRGQTVIVQVDKDPVGSKGARLTTYISLAGRYLVLTPYSQTRGVSRKIEDPVEREKHRELVAKLNPPRDTGIILRTAAFRQNKRDLARDMNYLIRLWSNIQAKSRKISQPGLLHSDADLVTRVLRDYYSNDMDTIWIDDAGAMEKARKFADLYLPRQENKLKLYTEKSPIFSSFGVENQIEELQSRRVSLPSGGSLVIDQTEALVAIDVNSGKTRAHRNQEENAFETNVEAAKEIARQLRLRNLGGIVVIDFIDMSSSKHIAAVERTLRDAMRNDKAQHNLGRISSFGLGTLTRQRLDQSIRIVGYRQCPTCKGDGIIRSPDAVAVRLLRAIQTGVADGKSKSVRIRLHPELANHVQNRHRRAISALEREFDVFVEIEAIPDLDRSEELVEYSPRIGEAMPSPPADDSIQKNETTTKRKRRRRKKKAPAVGTPTTQEMPPP